MRKIEVSIFVGNLATMKGIAKIAKDFYVDVKWINVNRSADIAILEISGRVTEMLFFKDKLPKLRKEGSVYSV